MTGVVHVRIATDGMTFIDDEYFAPTPGVPTNAAVLAHLQLEAAARQAPIHAAIRDDQAAYTTDIRVAPDGTSQPATAPAPHATAAPEGHTRPTGGSAHGQRLSPSVPTPPDRPYALLSDPYRTRLQTVCATANHNKFAAAAREADQLLTELTARHGADHLYTLSAGHVRGDIAWLAKDYRCGWKSWSYLAKVWNQHLGPQHTSTILAVGNSVGCWHRLSPGEARATAPQLLALLHRITIPGSDQALKRIHHRRSQLTQASKIG
ncbi:hypothetical protein ACWF94_02300 [Streptomyces sp. NPDC055078]